jgi:hypothetical protein
MDIMIPEVDEIVNFYTPETEIPQVLWSDESSDRKPKEVMKKDRLILLIFSPLKRPSNAHSMFAVLPSVSPPALLQLEAWYSIWHSI